MTLDGMFSQASIENAQHEDIVMRVHIKRPTPSLNVDIEVQEGEIFSCPKCRHDVIPSEDYYCWNCGHRLNHAPLARAYFRIPDHSGCNNCGVYVGPRETQVVIRSLIRLPMRQIKKARYCQTCGHYVPPK